MNITKNILRSEYLKKHRTIGEIATSHGLSRYNVRKTMVKFGIPIRTKFDVGAHELLGHRFGKLVVIGKENTLRGGTYWKCRCSCGKEKTIRGSSLVGGTTRSCGCLWKRSSYGDISGEYISSLKYNAKRRKIKFEVSLKFMWDLFLSQEAKCAISGVPIKFGRGLTTDGQTASMDRIDSTKGYIEGNLRWVHKDINQMKMDMSDKLFFEWIEKVSTYNKS